MMPGLTGDEICRRLRQLHDRPYVYVILLTSQIGKPDVIAGLRAGADDYLCKPFLPIELQCRLQTGSRILRLQDRLIAARDGLMDRATHDDLTGIWNRGAIRDRLKWVLENSRPSSAGVALADVDHFKLVNDTRGHAIGDELLVEVARRLKAGLHPDDRIGRCGGDEFLIVFSGCCTPDGLLATADGLRTRVSQSPFESPGGSVSVSMSLGVTFIPPECRGPFEQLLQTADRALYQAKANGRDRAEFLPCSLGELQPVAAPDFDASISAHVPCLVGAPPT
jgi:diguanylate cyclase (GGDEF)-like protein